MAEVRYRVQIFKRGSDQEVEFTLQTQLGSTPTVGGQVIRPLQGRTESRPWSFLVVDEDEILTSKLADPSTGRAWLLGRVARVQRSIDGGPWVSLDTGRLTHIAEDDGPGLYEVQVQDERWVERQAIAFENEEPTTQVWPAGIARGWFRDIAWSAPTWLGHWVAARFPDSILGGIWWVAIKLLPYGPVSQSTVDFIRAQLKSLREEKRHRLWLWSEVLGKVDPETSKVTWGAAARVIALAKSPNSWDPMWQGAGSDYLDEFNPRRDKFSPVVWVVIKSGEGLTWRDDPTKRMTRLIASEGPPTDHLPYHVGVVTNPVATPFASGIDPFELVEQLYKKHGVRYNATALAALKRRYPPVAFRLTRAARLAQWLEDQIYGPLLVAPFTDSEGRVAPKSIAMPIMTQGEFDALFEFNASNIAEDGYPTWDHASRDRVNVLLAEFEDHTFVTEEEARSSSDFGMDRLKVVEDVTTREHDSVVYMPRSELTIQARGFWGSARDGVIDTLAREVFDRFGDGPVRGRMIGLLSTGEVEPGDFVKINLDTFPNLATNTRGGVRVVQILSKLVLPDGYEFEFLDAGPSLQPLPAPTVTAQKSDDDPRHAIEVTLSGVDGEGTAIVQVSLSSDFSEIIRMRTTDEGTTIIDQLPAGTTFYVRAVNNKPGRIRGVWSATATATTDALPAPTSLAAEEVTEHTALIVWEPGDDGLVTGVMLNKDGVPQDWGPEHIVATLEPGATRYELTSLEGPDASYAAAVQHLDPYGGRSGVAATTLTTVGETITAPRPAGIAIVMGML